MGPYIVAVARAIPRQHWDAVFYTNAVRVFQLRSIPDDSDFVASQAVCPHADQRATIVLRGCDSRVRNTRVPTGCTLANLIQDAWATDGEEGLAALVDALETHGLLSAVQAAAIISCIEEGTGP